MKLFSAWRQSREGATAIEYAFIAGGIAMAIVAAVFLLGDELEILFNSMASAMNNANSKI